MNRSFARNLVLLVSPALLSACAGLEMPAGIGDILGAGGFGTGSGSSQATVVAGLREALRVGTERSVALTSRPGGFLDNAQLRIPVPSELETMTGALRTIGLGREVDHLETEMNRAAERAAGEATQVFVDSITSMSLSDGLAILNGGPTAATEYFREETGDTLRARFSPIVDDAMQRVGLARGYAELTAAYDRIPFAKPPAFDLERYITDRALDGLFTTLAGEERRIREDPAARTSELLRQVFGSSG